MFQSLERAGFRFEFRSHAKAILSSDFPDAVSDLERVLSDITIPIEEIIGSGGGEAKGTQRLRRALAEHGWQKLVFTIDKVVNGVPRESTSHEVDHVRQFEQGTIALEIEWNNKDPFFDRDLENFKRLHAEGAISVGVVVTRGASLQAQMRELVRRFVDEHQIVSLDDLVPFGVIPTPRQRKSVEQRMQREKNPLAFREAWVDQFVSDKYGAATTHWAKLEDRLRRGVGNPCPLLLVGLPASIVSFDETASDLGKDDEDAVD